MTKEELAVWIHNLLEADDPTANDITPRTLISSDTPSKRANKNRSGRTGIKRAHGQAALRAVGGYDVSTPGRMAYAISLPADTLMCRTYEEWLEAGRR